MRLVEREREQAQLGELIGTASAGHGGLAIIEAAAGLGKTRLLQAARERAFAAGLRVLGARGTELERDFPFALVRQLFEPALAGLDEAARDTVFEGAAGAARGALGMPAPPTDAFGILHGLYWLTAALAERQPLLLAVDDAHWSDAASLDFFAFLVPRIEELPVLLAVACRPDEPGADERLGRLTTDGVAHRLSPRPLSAGAAAAVLADELGADADAAFATACHEVSGGNPFLLRELARTIAAEAIPPQAAHAARVRELVPERVMRTVAVRLARLSGDAQAIARALVVLGDDADRTVVAALAGADPDAVASAADELRGASIFDGGSTLRFVHPLMRTALEAELAAGAREAQHRRAAELLRARGASPEDLAAHLMRTDVRGDRATAETLFTAARAALERGAPRSAAAYLSRALREPAPADLRPAILSSLVTAGIRAPDPALFAAVLPEVLAELERDPALSARWGGKISVWMILHGRGQDAVPLLERAVEVANERGDVEGAFRLEAQLSLVAPRPLVETRARLEGYVRRIPADSAGGRLAAALESEWHAYDGTADAAVDAARRALARDGRIFTEQPEFFSAGRPMLALGMADRLDEAQRAAERAMACARQRSATPELVAASWQGSMVAWARGDLAAAEADARQALGVARLGGLWFAEQPMQALVAGMLVARGELDAAEAELAAGGMTGEIAPGFVLALALAVRGRLRYEQGRFEEAVADFLKLERMSRAWGAMGVPGPTARLGAARAVAALGDPERARPKAEAALAHARHFGAATSIAYALVTVAMTADEDERLALSAEAVTLLEGSPARLVRAEVLCDHGAALRRAGRRADARAPLREALDVARRCGAGGLARRAFDELTATGERVRRHTPIGAESLTPSERRVAELAASGMTNRQIAQTLFLTVKTIETHLAAVYDKLGIKGRRELAGALADGGSRRSASDVGPSAQH